MSIPRRTLLPILACIGVAAVCARLGVWQLNRLTERRAWNAHLQERLAAPPIPVTQLPVDSAAGHYRRVSATGVFDFNAQVVLATRSRQGSPGVHVLTPLRLAGDTVVMINRGWVYSGDAKTLDFAKWREHERDTVTVTGYAETWSGHEPPTPSSALRTVRALDSSAVAGFVGHPIAPYYVVQTSDTGRVTDRPVRLGEPELAEGSHKGYAVQWFSFALVALIGGSLFVRQAVVEGRAS